MSKGRRKGDKFRKIIREHDLGDVYPAYIRMFARYPREYAYNRGEGWKTARYSANRNDPDCTEYKYPRCEPTQIARHLTEPGYAIGLRGYSKEVRYFDIDLDGWQGTDEIDANFKKPRMDLGRLERMYAVRDYFGEHSVQGQLPVIVLRRGPSGNFTVLGRCEPLTLSQMLYRLEYIAKHEIGLPTKPGTCELYPQFGQPRRLPFAADQAIVSCGMVNISGTKAEDIQLFLNMPPFDLDAIYQEIKAEHDTGTREKKEYDSTDYVMGRFNAMANQMYTVGLVEPFTRHYTQTKLIYYFWKAGLTEEGTYDKIAQWYYDGRTNGFSVEWANDLDGVLRRLRHHIRTYYAWLHRHDHKPMGIGSGIDTSATLSHSDIMKIFKIANRLDIPRAKLQYGEWLFDLLLYAKQRAPVKDHLYLSQKIMRRQFKNGDTRYTTYRDHAIESRLLTFKERYRCGRHSNVYRLNNTFADKSLLPEGMHYRNALTQVYDRNELMESLHERTVYRLLKKT